MPIPEEQLLFDDQHSFIPLDGMQTQRELEQHKQLIQQKHDGILLFLTYATIANEILYRVVAVDHWAVRDNGGTVSAHAFGHDPRRRS